MSSDRFDYRMWIIGRQNRLAVSDIWAQFAYAGMSNDIPVSFRSHHINKPAVVSSEVEGVLDRAHISSFEVVGREFSFSYGQNGGSGFDQIIIDARSSLLDPKLSDELISETVAGDPDFIQAHLVDSGYEYRQNIFDPLQFKALGISMVGLPMKSNGLPFPLERQVVDVSRNPGRFSLRSGYVEASAAFMWFGEIFWKIVGSSPEEISVNLPSGVSLQFDKCWKLAASGGIFRDEKTKEIQDGIRRVVFGFS